MKTAKKIVIAATLLFGLISVPAFAYGPFEEGLLPSGVWMNEIGAPITVEIDGAYLPTDVQPEIRDGRTFLPMRVVAESMDCAVNWDQAKYMVTITKDGNKLEFFVGRSIYYVNGQQKTASVALYIKDGRTLLPVRDFAESFGAQVNWDGDTASVNIYTGGPVQKTPDCPEGISEDIQWLFDKYYVEPGPNGTGTWYKSDPDGDAILFVSQLSNGEKTGICISNSEIVGDVGSQQCVMVNGAIISPRNDGIDVTPATGIYFYGPSMGFQGSTTNHYNFLEDNLLLTGTTFTFMESYYSPKNDIYTLIE